MAGYIILIASRTAGLSYFAVFLAACGIYPTIPNIVAWVSNNVEGTYKRSVSLAMVISFGNINGAVSSNVVSYKHDNVVSSRIAVLTLRLSVSSKRRTMVQIGTRYSPDVYLHRDDLYSDLHHRAQAREYEARCRRTR